MKDPYHVILDAQFPRDIVRLRYEFDTEHLGNSGNHIKKVRVSTPQDVNSVRLSIRMSDLYIVAFHNEFGSFYMSDAGPIPGEEGGSHLAFSTHYQSLGIWAGSENIARSSVLGAVTALAEARNKANADRQRKNVGMMALAVSESLRQDIVLELFSSLFSGMSESISRRVLKSVVNSYSKNIKRKDPYVALKPWT